MESATGLRGLLLDFIKLKNEVPRHELKSFNRVPSDFAPEEGYYYEGLVSNMIIVFWIMILLFAILVILVVGRFACKCCDATLDREDGNFEFKRSSHVGGTWVVGLVLLLSLAGLLYGSIELFRAVSKARLELTAQAGNQANDVQSLITSISAY